MLMFRYLQWNIVKNGFGSGRSQTRGCNRQGQGNPALSSNSVENTSIIKSPMPAKKTLKKKNNSLFKSFNSLAISTKQENKFMESLKNDSGLQRVLKDLSQPESEIRNLVDRIKSLAQKPMSYQMETRRRTFNEEARKQWEQMESLVVLVYLHHSHLLSLIENKEDMELLMAQDNVKEELKRIAEERNEVISYMIVESQIEREFQDMVRDFFDGIKEMVTKKMLQEMREREEEKRREEEVQRKTEKKKEPKSEPSKKDKIREILKQKQKKKCEKAQSEQESAKEEEYWEE